MGWFAAIVIGLAFWGLILWINVAEDSPPPAPAPREPDNPKADMKGFWIGFAIISAVCLLLLALLGR